MPSLSPNDERQPPEAAATRSRRHTEEIGCLRLAGRSGSAGSLPRPPAESANKTSYTKCGHGEQSEEHQGASPVHLVIRVEGRMLPSFPNVPQIKDAKDKNEGTRAHADQCSLQFHIRLEAEPVVILTARARPRARLTFVNGGFFISL